MEKNAHFVFFAILIAGTFLFKSCGQSPRQERTGIETEKPFLNALTPDETEQGFVLMFDGKSFDGWRGYNQSGFPQSGWIIDNGLLKIEGAGSGESGGDIIYDRKFRDFHLKLEWKVSEGGNSGILYLAQEIEGEPIWTSAPEMQILDNKKFIETYQGFSPLQMSGSLYDLVPADPQNTKPAGEWNTVEIILTDGVVLHYQNGALVVECHIDSPDWEEKVATSKFAEYAWFGKYEPGYIGLQDHGDDTWFRNLKIKEL